MKESEKKNVKKREELKEEKPKTIEDKRDQSDIYAEYIEAYRS